MLSYSWQKINKILILIKLNFEAFGQLNFKTNINNLLIKDQKIYYVEINGDRKFEDQLQINWVFIKNYFVPNIEYGLTSIKKNTEIRHTKI